MPISSPTVCQIALRHWHGYGSSICIWIVLKAVCQMLCVLCRLCMISGLILTGGALGLATGVIWSLWAPSRQKSQVSSLDLLARKVESPKQSRERVKLVSRVESLVALNRRFRIEHRAIRIVRFQGDGLWFGLAILNRFSAILLYCDSNHF